jgi:hypothetical protein
MGSVGVGELGGNVKESIARQGESAANMKESSRLWEVRNEVDIRRQPRAMCIVDVERILDPWLRIVGIWRP